MIASPLTFMLKTSSIQLTKSFSLSTNMDTYVEIGRSGSSDETIERLPPHIKITFGATGYLTPDAKVNFTKLGKAFTKALILCHFDPECHI